MTRQTLRIASFERQMDGDLQPIRVHRHPQGGRRLAQELCMKSFLRELQTRQRRCSPPASMPMIVLGTRRRCWSPCRTCTTLLLASMRFFSGTRLRRRRCTTWTSYSMSASMKISAANRSLQRRATWISPTSSRASTAASRRSVKAATRRLAGPCIAEVQDESAGIHGQGEAVLRHPRSGNRPDHTVPEEKTADAEKSGLLQPSWHQPSNVLDVVLSQRI